MFQDLFWKTYFGGRGASSGLKLSYGEYTVPVCVAQFKDTKLRMPVKAAKQLITVTVPYMTNPDALHRGDVLWCHRV